MGLVNSAQLLVQEHKSDTLQRLMATAMKPWEIVVGQMLGGFTIVFLQMALLMVFGQLLLGVSYLREPVSVLLVTVAAVRLGDDRPAEYLDPWAGARFGLATGRNLDSLCGGFFVLAVWRFRRMEM